MRKFNVTVNGMTYEVEVEEVGAAPVYPSAPVFNAAPVYAAPVAAPAPVAPAAAPAPKAAAPAPKAAAPAPKAAAPAAGGEAITAPMPGNILDVRVKVGQAVKKGDILIILEAMKMENEIMAHRDGVVASISATKGTSVNTGDTLLSLN